MYVFKDVCIISWVGLCMILNVGESYVHDYAQQNSHVDFVNYKTKTVHA